MCQQGNLYDFKKFVIIHYSTLLLLFQNGQNLKKKKKWSYYSKGWSPLTDTAHSG